ncbi:hypothetical protein OIDMADRAFT_20474 [Oidiodendron maius Zn]|uniref:Uncharacterized protein n=1 Tax=Oidiodendron maius (strain Zn) TaxID=913774 RepID=A0A0C3CE95_OIDMZ|nr:hypothetical protein OIDMADRAFT_20474 [Oidiodendron maius Zn]
MRVILTGSTGYIGNAILQQCLSNLTITSITALSRHDLAITDPKLEVIHHSDFSFYPPELISKLSTADACIYCLGTNIPIKPLELNRTINFDYALATTRMFASLQERTKKSFRFVYLSGALPEKDPKKKLWFVAENRHMRGELENSLLEFGKEKENTGFEVFIVRPGFVQAKDAQVKARILELVGFKTIVIQDLAASMVDIALKGYSEALVENEVLISIGRKVALGSSG